MPHIRPLLAETINDLELLRLPVYASAKLDGLRCVISGAIATSRNGKPFRNRYVQSVLGQYCFNGLDGELIVGPPSGELVYNRTNSGITSAEGEPDFTFWVFDNWQLAMAPFIQRFNSLFEFPRHPRIRILPQRPIGSLTELADFERQTLDAGFEGVMLRRPDGPYKQGRSTLVEQILLRVKRFRDGEAKIIDLLEGKLNMNEPTLNALGYTERSTHKANMQGNGKVGTVVGVDTVTGEKMNISPGKLTHEQRARYWAVPSLALDRICKYKTFDYGVVDNPRFTTFQGFADGHP